MSVLTTTLSYIKSAKIYSDEGLYYGIISKWEVHLSNCIKIYNVILIKGNEYSTKNFNKGYYFQVDDRTIPSLKRDTKVEWGKQFTCISFRKEDFQEFEFNLMESDKKYENQIFDLQLKNKKVKEIFKRILEDCLTRYIKENQSFAETDTLLSGTTRSSLSVNGDIETKSIWRSIFCCCSKT